MGERPVASDAAGLRAGRQLKRLVEPVELELRRRSRGVGHGSVERLAEALEPSCHEAQDSSTVKPGPIDPVPYQSRSPGGSSPGDAVDRHVQGVDFLRLSFEALDARNR